MRPLFRILFNSFTALSLILLAAAVVLRARSHKLQDEWYRVDFIGERRLSQWSKVLSRKGVIAFAREEPTFRLYFDLPTKPGEWSHRVSPAPDVSLADSLLWRPTAVNRVGLVYHKGRQIQMELGQAPFVPSTVIGLPYFVIGAVLAVSPMIRAFGWIRGRWYRLRAARGLCAQCGYDLRATPGRCPECGPLHKTSARPSSM